MKKKKDKIKKKNLRIFFFLFKNYTKKIDLLINKNNTKSKINNLNLIIAVSMSEPYRYGIGYLPPKF